jgi:ribosomal protein S12 methylthiotransferase accessory factor
VKRTARQIVDDHARGATEELCRSIREIDAETGKVFTHSLRPRRDCATCGRLYDGSADLETHCSPKTGMVRSVQVTGHPFWGAFGALGEFVAPLPEPGARSLLQAQFAVGRGLSRKDAIDSCIGEAIERYSVIYTGRERLLRHHIGEAGTLDPAVLLLVSDRQYDCRDEWNLSRDERYWVPERPAPDQPADFLEGVDLISGEKVLVPAACCLMWYQFAAGEARFASADSIGCASARTIEEALAAALYEWIERDALAIWWYNRLRRPQVQPEAFATPELTGLQSQMEKAGRRLHLLDITTDVGIPAFAAICARLDGTQPIFGAAAHYSPRVAAVKAASEASQIAFTIVQLRGADSEIGAWIREASTSLHPWLAPSFLADPLPQPARLSPRQQVESCVQAMSSLGLRPLMVDQSAPDTSLRTIRAIIPGMRHIWARFAPGRLYDVPVRMGWRDRPLTESELNPVLCML